MPLIVVGPGFEPSTLDTPVETAVDLAASVLDFARITPPDSHAGVSLVPFLIRGDVGSRGQPRHSADARFVADAEIKRRVAAFEATKEVASNDEDDEGE